MQHSSNPKQGGIAEQRTSSLTMSIGESSNKTMGKRPGKRPGRKPSKIDERAKLERSRQSARECRARKKLRYQYLEELVSNREKAVFALRDELELYKQWCIQLENGGPVPEALLKMIATEDMSVKRRQMARLAKSLLQQRQHLEFHLSSSSSSSALSTPPDLSPSSSSHQEHSQQKLQRHHVHVVQPQHLANAVPHVSPVRHKMSSPATQHQQHQSPQQHQQHHQHQPMQQQKHSIGSPLLQRQMAFDGPLPQEQQFHQTPGPFTQSLASVSHGQHPDTQRSITEEHHPFLQLTQRQQPDATLQSQSSYPAFISRSPHLSKSEELSTPRLTSQPAITHGHSVDIPRICSDITGDNNRSNIIEAHRRRSLSNPATMASLSRPNMNITSADDLPSPLQEFITSHSSAYPTTTRAHLGFGLFSGSAIGDKPQTSTLNIPTTITVEDSCSSEDSISEKHLFQSSIASQKRAMSASLVPEYLKRSMTSTSSASSIPEVTNYDPHGELFRLENTYNFGKSVASCSSSPSSYGRCTSNTPSPSASPRYSSALSNSTPSSCANASPAPMSLSSILELSTSSPGTSYSTCSPGLELTPSTASAQGQRSIDLLPGNDHSFTHDPVPDWYSFLADLEEATSSTLTPQYGTQSLTCIQKSHEQPVTSNQQFMNVPDIIKEILDSDDQLV